MINGNFPQYFPALPMQTRREGTHGSHGLWDEWSFGWVYIPCLSGHNGLRVLDLHHAEDTMRDQVNDAKAMNNEMQCLAYKKDKTCEYSEQLTDLWVFPQPLWAKDLASWIIFYSCTIDIALSCLSLQNAQVYPIIEAKSATSLQEVASEGNQEIVYQAWAGYFALLIMHPNWTFRTCFLSILRYLQVYIPLLHRKQSKMPGMSQKPKYISGYSGNGAVL